MFDLDGFIETPVNFFFIICLLTLLKELACFIIDKFCEAVEYILGSIFGRDRNYDFVFKYAIYISMICFAIYFYWNYIFVPLYNATDISILFN